MIAQKKLKMLSYDDQSYILGRLVGLADKGIFLSQQLEQKGFHAFKAWQDFEHSFCEPEDVRRHDTYLTEEAKLFMGSPDGVPGHLAGKEAGYRSAIITEMRAARDRENGCTYDQIGEEEWKKEIDPCRRCLVRLSLEGSPVPDKRRKKMYSDFVNYRNEELRNLAPFASSQPKNEHIAQSFTSILGVQLKDLGFEFDSFRSKPFLPVFSKSLDEFWDLCWSEETDQNLELPAQYQGPHQRRARQLDLKLYVRAKRRRGSLMTPLFFKERDFMTIRYEKIVSGFEWAYSKYSDVSELEILLKARTALYRLLSSSLEFELAQALKDRRA